MLTNFYESVDKKKIIKYPNPYYGKTHFIKVPFRMLVVGASGAGKTNCALNIIKAMQNTFMTLTVVTKNKDEPLYNMLEEKLGRESFKIYEGLDNLPKLDTFQKDVNNLLIIDDMVNERDLSPVCDLYIRCRKLGVSVMFLSQSYFKIPKLIRQNANYVILLKVASTRDLGRIVSEYDIGLTNKELVELYKECTNVKMDFLMIYTDASPDEYKYFHNFNPINV